MASFHLSSLQSCPSRNLNLGLAPIHWRNAKLKAVRSLWFDPPVSAQPSEAKLNQQDRNLLWMILNASAKYILPIDNPFIYQDPGCWICKACAKWFIHNAYWVVISLKCCQRWFFGSEKSLRQTLYGAMIGKIQFSACRNKIIRLQLWKQVLSIVVLKWMNQMESFCKAFARTMGVI